MIICDKCNAHIFEEDYSEITIKFPNKSEHLKWLCFSCRRKLEELLITTKRKFFESK